jgi:hypothetical protein
MMSFLHYVFARKDPDMADWFMEALETGSNLDRDEPVHLLRERLTDNRANRRKMSEKEMFALTILAWNYTRKGKRVKILRWRTEGLNPQPFPEIE